MRHRAARRNRQPITPYAECSDHGPQYRLEMTCEFTTTWQAVACLGRDDHVAACGAEHSPEERLTFSLAVHVGGVEEIDPGVSRHREQSHEAYGITLKHAPDSRAAEAQSRDLQIRVAEGATLHEA